MKLSILFVPLLAAVASCATQVSHPTKSEAEMRVDIKACTDQANHKYWMDPIAALYHAYDCLEAMGYQREHGDLSGRVEQAMGESRRQPQPKAPAQPCHVPCRSPH
jgi:hypothetical protein